MRSSMRQATSRGETPATVRAITKVSVCGSTGRMSNALDSVV
ncbi:hypothetical protein [Rhodanobacter thiooxydans]